MNALQFFAALLVLVYALYFNDTLASHVVLSLLFYSVVAVCLFGAVVGAWIAVYTLHVKIREMIK